LVPSTKIARRRLSAATIFSRNNAQSLDQIERAASHLVGTVDREVDVSMLAE
jgi:hypothetical protein